MIRRGIPLALLLLSGIIGTGLVLAVSRTPSQPPVWVAEASEAPVPTPIHTTTPINVSTAKPGASTGVTGGGWSTMTPAEQMLVVGGGALVAFGAFLLLWVALRIMDRSE